LRTVLDGRHLSTHRYQLVLGLCPIALGDEVLHLVQFGACRKGNLIVAHLLRRPEEHRAQAVEGIAGAGTGHHRTEAANAQHSGRGRTDNTEPTTGARGCGSPLLPRRTDRIPGQAGVQRGDRVGFRDQTRRRRRAQLVAPPTKEGRQFGVSGILRCGRTP
jgi:hypothetical protein